MKKINVVLILFLLIITLSNFAIITDSISDSFTVCINNLIPSLIPFLLFSNIIIKKGLLPINIYTLDLLCIISGSPSNAKYIKDYIENKIIDENGAKKLLNYLQYVNPLYILNGIGLVILNNKKLGLVIFISNLLSSIVLKYVNKSIKFNTKYECNKSSFSAITTSIRDTIDTILYITGVITFFFIVTTYVSIVFDVNEKYKFLYGFIEITQGINYLKYSNLSIYLKVVFSTIFISFGGFSIHLQVFGILENKKIRYLSYLYHRILHSIISAIIVSVIFYILN